MFNTATASVLIYTSVLACNRVAHASGPALQKTAWTEMCATATEMRSFPAVANTKLEKTQGLMTEYQQTALRLEAVAGTAQDQGDSLVIASLASKLNEAAAEAQGDLESLRPKALKATAAASAVYGGISEFLTLIYTAVGGNTGGCVSDSDNGDVISSKSSLSNCPIDREISLSETSSTLESTFAANALTTLKSATAVNSGSAATKCVIFAAPGQGTAKVFQTAPATAIAGGTLKVSGSTPDIATNYLTTISSASGTAGAKLIIQAHTATRQLLAQITPDPTTAVKNKVKELAGDLNFAKIIVKNLKLIGMKGSDSTLEAYAKSKIKNLLADGGANFDSKWQALIDTQVYDGKIEEVKTEKASSITSTKELIQSVLYYQIDLKTKFKRVKEELEQKKNDCEKKPQKPECNGKEEGECGTTKGCEWNKTKEKCKLTKKAPKPLVTPAVRVDNRILAQKQHAQSLIDIYAE
uniref:Variant surface glycoprotein 1158 n=1 Tax=Trypanosoma brucei TaxID=5691 RepID=M4SZG0_9TRYP|nr:variant surface glycoprotein 1158 [Trypanosoma brucei]